MAYGLSAAVEELMEMLGTVSFCYGITRYLQQHQQHPEPGTAAAAGTAGCGRHGRLAARRRPARCAPATPDREHRPRTGRRLGTGTADAHDP